MLTIKALAGGDTYVARHLSNNDYYAVGETVTGEWIGRGAELLGLTGAFSAGPPMVVSFRRIRAGAQRRRSIARHLRSA